MKLGSKAKYYKASLWISVEPHHVDPRYKSHALCCPVATAIKARWPRSWPRAGNKTCEFLGEEWQYSQGLIRAVERFDETGVFHPGRYLIFQRAEKEV